MIFLTSSFVKGCGEVLARKKFIRLLEMMHLLRLKKAEKNLFLVSGMTDKKS
ncbi:MAG: hypothetical protein L6V78_07055 [Clostridium sp.]|nr:MAG: hypothetical protein L6V78_07055 [Clostridium sp.]